MTIVRNLIKSPYDFGGVRLPACGEVDVDLPENMLDMLRANPAFMVIDRPSQPKRGRPRKDV